MATMMGYTFASRVAASLLMDAGEVGLVAHNSREFFWIVDTLLSQPEQLVLLRKRLETGRNKLRKFDTLDYAMRFGEVVLMLLAHCSR